jgi:hypothetical protein
MPKQTVRSPYATGEAKALSPRLFRKQILRFSEIDYHGRPIKFDKDYANAVVQSFRDSAFDTVPFVLADADNKHTRDPERVRGEVVDLEVTDNGLDALVSLTESAASLIKEHPKMGVSVSIREQFQRADGKSFPAALAHVLGTFEPMLPGMSPWQTINASVGDEEVLDLTTVNLAGDKTKEKKVGKYTEEQQEALFARLEQLLANLSTDDEETEDEVEETETEVDENDELTADEVEELRAWLAAYDSQGEGEVGDIEEVDAEQLVNASITDHPQVVEMSNTIRQLRAENDRRAFEQERDQIVRDFGIPPAVVDLARPLLQGTGHAVELSETGKKVDGGQVMREVLKAIGQQIKLIDLSGELGNNLDFTSRQADEDELNSARMDKVKSVRRQMNI